MRNDKRLNWVLRTKVDRSTHDQVSELANHFQKGNISGLLRKMITDWLELFADGHTPNMRPDEAPAALRLALYERRLQKRQEMRERLAALWLSVQDVQEDPESEELVEELEELGQELAEKHDLSWPPAAIRPAKVDADLRRIMDRLEALWYDNSHEGGVSLRELNRSLSMYDAADLREHLERLEKLGELILDGDRIANTSLMIYNIID